MNLVVLDTTVASFLFGARPQLALYADDLVGHLLALPFQTSAELLVGAERRGWGKSRRTALARFIASHVALGVTDEVIEAWVTIMAHAEKIGRSLGEADGWVAACAHANGAPLLTHDADLRGLGVRGLNVVCHAP